ncbi:hypothetical protein O3G_MSEX011900 [Manduca sexta]|uniref:Ataxin-2 C-terminal domain-containing protein n=1 Tax=Manduca sexta TaxID=7130 RepID=A0A921ZME2_MANSE|nr:hypothetical protein O3G_MSEX011900 [Manduca sexta]
MAGAFYPPGAFPAVPAAPQDDFADYMWMEHEEEFDKQVMQQLEEEALMEQCIEAMLEDEQRERNNRPVANGHKQHLPTTSNGAPSLSLEETVSRSTLNPLAAEFVPTRVRPTPANTEEEKPEPPEPPAPEVPQKEIEPTSAPLESRADTTEEPKTEEPVPSQKDPPEVSAADVHPITEKAQDKRPKEPKKDTRPKQEAKKPVKTEVKPKPKPQPIKSETKVQPKKKEVKSVKSEGKVEEKRPEVREEKCEDAPAVVEAAKVVEKAQTPPIEDPSIPKPINYAAAAKANKPKKPTTPPASDKSTPPPQPPVKPKAVEKVKKPEKPPVKEKVNAPRKNSTK